MLMLLNEAVWCLEDNILQNPKDGDIGGVFGVGFLPWSGGPFSYMNLLGLDHVVNRMEHYSSIHGPKFNPRPLLKSMADKGGKIYCLTDVKFIGSSITTFAIYVAGYSTKNSGMT